jgi:uncharacterized damage-inducible protein DinB
MLPVVMIFHPHGAHAPLFARQYNRAAMKAMLVDLARHQSWADAEHLRAFEAHGRAAEDSIIQARLHHLHQVQRGFLWLAKGLDPSGFTPTKPEDFRSLASLREYARGSSAAFADFTDQVGDERLQERISIPWFPKVPPFTLTVAEALMQALTHSQWHRGQNATRLRELGGEPPTVDLIVWYLKGRPPAAWS